MLPINWETIILALIASIPALIVALRTHNAVNSRVTEMIALVKKEAEQRGKTEGIKDEKAAQAMKREGIAAANRRTETP